MRGPFHIRHSTRRQSTSLPFFRRDFDNALLKLFGGDDFDMLAPTQQYQGPLSCVMHSTPRIKQIRRYSIFHLRPLYPPGSIRRNQVVSIAMINVVLYSLYATAVRIISYHYKLCPFYFASSRNLWAQELLIEIRFLSFLLSTFSSQGKQRSLSPRIMELRYISYKGFHLVLSQNTGSMNHGKNSKREREREGRSEGVGARGSERGRGNESVGART